MKKIMFFIISLLTIWNCKSQDLSKDQKIIHEIDSIRQRFHIPGLAFGVANCDCILIAGGLGIRQIKTTDSVTINDYFHIASLGKGLFSFITGKIVDEGKIGWDTRFFDLFVYSEQSDPHSEQIDPPCREANPEGLPEGQFG